MIVTTVVFADGHSETKRFRDWRHWSEETSTAIEVTGAVTDDVVSMTATQVAR